MKNLSIPEEDIEALLLFENLNSASKNWVIEVFSSFDKGQSYEITAEKIAQNSSLNKFNALSIISVYFALLRTIGVYEYDQEEFITTVIENTSAQFNLKPLNKIKITNALRTLLTIDNENVLLTSLAMYLTSQSSNIVTGFSAFNDLKPIQVKGKISGIVLSNVLKFKYRGEGSEENLIYLTFDSEDLDQLVNQLTELKKSNQLLKEKYVDDIIEI